MFPQKELQVDKHNPMQHLKKFLTQLPDYIFYAVVKQSAFLCYLKLIPFIIILD